MGYSMERTLLRTAISLRRAKGRDKVEAIMQLRNYIPRGFTVSLFNYSAASSAFAHASFLFFLPSSIRPRHLALIHAGIGTLIHPPDSSHLGSRKVLDRTLQIHARRKLQTTSGCSSWLVPPLRECLAIRADTLTALLSIQLRLFFSFCRSENLLIRFYFIHPTLVPSLKTIFVRSYMRTSKGRVAVNMGMYLLHPFSGIR